MTYEVVYRDRDGQIVQAFVTHDEQAAIMNAIELQRIGIKAFYREKKKAETTKDL